MKANVAQQLRDLNHTFYAALAEPFARSRKHAQPGFSQLADRMPADAGSLLDVGCGEGRFGRFLLSQYPSINYTGVDFTGDLLNVAKQTLDGTFYERDLFAPNALDGIASADIVACLATLQHIPSTDARVTLMRQLASKLRLGGHLLLSNWQFMSSERQRRKVQPWSTIGLHADDVDENDFLLTWQRGGDGLRYVRLIKSAEIEQLATAANLTVIDSFRADGKEGDLNLYSILTIA